MQKISFIALLVGCYLGIGLSLESSIVDEVSLKTYDIAGDADLIIRHNGYVIGYSYQYRQAVWTCYILTAEEVSQSKIKRENNFKADPAVISSPVFPEEYSKTGYDKGHLVPAKDMSYSLETMQNSFFMSNISPQLPGFNRGIWRRLESFVRTTAEEEGRILVISGPIFSTAESTAISKPEIPVPVAFYKIIFDLTPPQKIICFIIPNSSSAKRVEAYMDDLADVEKLTHLSFFPSLPQHQKEELEKNNHLFIRKGNPN